MTKLYNKSTEKEKRRSLRNNMPLAEKIIWEKLRGRQIEACKFRRQYSIGTFVVDFYAPELKLALEIDGDSHFLEGAKEYDNERSAFLSEKGATILRFTNREIHENLNGVLETIAQNIQDLRKSTPPLPSPCKGEGAKSNFPPLQEEESKSNFPPLQGGTKGGEE